MINATNPLEQFALMAIASAHFLISILINMKVHARVLLGVIALYPKWVLVFQMLNAQMLRLGWDTWPKKGLREFIKKPLRSVYAKLIFHKHPTDIALELLRPVVAPNSHVNSRCYFTQCIMQMKNISCDTCTIFLICFQVIQKTI